MSSGRDEDMGMVSSAAGGGGSRFERRKRCGSNVINEGMNMGVEADTSISCPTVTARRGHGEDN